MQTVALIDYGSGNLRSAEKALREAARRRALDADIVVTADPDLVAKADRVFLPGVGAFASCRAGLDATGVYEAMNQAVHGRGVPFMGICVGHQLLATEGLEFGVTPGLNWIQGQVKKLEPNDPTLTIPHMGWNAISLVRLHALFAGIDDGAHMYFANSFALTPSHMEDVVATADHGGPFTAAVAKDNVAGVQFHPEKSQASGLALLANFLEWRP
ncbi:imidazole glycerol phosphate synthase subunit HisH [Caulobacter vibrioides]|uniref:imidazole glycerol phosphate synthase subunit HisH n=1 Tax=Caulobacter vibrioides TaxID=155892 RepID=UPI000BB501D1|nr:imidazole glycerol phosphate synthase subunit HisH [Caulobacter vibrioides]ATC26628.1 imidazole glycerol phosphate synthase subunit HisH [Caulobacter vibrioides]AZH14715.1 imidazole glycerol phosphate synthase subunit HisH [Caulobacter vibrioides]PLR12452.1 imidazole glycerol phosphate synthase subunit HisH [Caulobacter vibrioides]